VLAHNISLINVQAGVALHLIDQQPEQARSALAAIKQASKDTLGELGSVLDVLRHDDEALPRSPTSGLARLDELVARAEAAGLVVRTRIEGEPRPLPTGMDLAAFRIVQEALTNVTRHAGPATATVRVAYGQGELTVQVDDDGRGARRGRRGQRHPRHARACHRPRRPAGGRSAAGWRVPGARPAAAGRPPVTPERSAGEGAAVVRVLLADDQVLVRAGFRALLDAQDGIEVVGEAGDGEEAVRLAQRLLPDVVLMDIRMPGVDGLAATRTIAADERLAGVRVVVLTTFELDEYVFEALRVGASGFLVKDTEPVELIRAVRAVASGDALLSPSVTRRLIAQFATRAKQPRPAPELDVLTEREREVMALVATGLSNEEIAERLVVSPATAKTHVSRAMVKLGARDRAQAVVFAYESGLVRPGWLD
jgi:DNA-binding NarL/FixJ family response regulator